MGNGTSLTMHLERRGVTVATDPETLADYRRAWITYRRDNGYKEYAPLLSPPDANRKLAKNVTPTYGLHLAPADMSGTWNVCNWSTPQCRAACVLVTGGRSVRPNVRRARIVKTRFLGDQPDAFVSLLGAEIRAAVARHGRIVVRLNVASDIRWERIAPSLFRIPGARFYDYSKAPVTQRTGLPRGYRVTYSVSEREHSTTNALAALEHLANAAVVFATRKGAPLPETWNGYRVIDGDVSDDRSRDPRGIVVGLRAKGSARGTDGAADGFVKPAIAT